MVIISDFSYNCNTELKGGFVSSFPCHSHSALCNVYPVALDRTRRYINISDMTMTGKIRYKVGPLDQ